MARKRGAGLVCSAYLHDVPTSTALLLELFRTIAVISLEDVFGVQVLLEVSRNGAENPTEIVHNIVMYEEDPNNLFIRKFII